MALQAPYGLGRKNYIERGSTGIVSWLNDEIVIKYPFRFKEGQPTNCKDLAMADESRTAIQREQEAFRRIADAGYHPNILQSIQHTPEGIFLPRMKMDLRARLANDPGPSNFYRARWVSQLVSATVWLEEKGLAHGDICPENVLFDSEDRIKLADFGSCVDAGEKLIKPETPYWDCYTQLAGPLTEQFALGSCIYYIVEGREPEIDSTGDPVRFYEVPDTFGILFGSVMFDCWMLQYKSTVEVEAAIHRVLAFEFPKETVAMVLSVESVSPDGPAPASTSHPSMTKKLELLRTSFMDLISPIAQFSRGIRIVRTFPFIRVSSGYRGGPESHEQKELARMKRWQDLCARFVVETKIK